MATKGEKKKTTKSHFLAVSLEFLLTVPRGDWTPEKCLSTIPVKARGMILFKCPATLFCAVEVCA